MVSAWGSVAQRLQLPSYHFTTLQLDSCNTKEKATFQFILKSYAGGYVMKCTGIFQLVPKKRWVVLRKDDGKGLRSGGGIGGSSVI
eukprot:15367014-Ditylum_brightwellii.AAC.1